MKIIYIADNRCRSNFGCRGTSIALSQLLQSKHDIVATISGQYTHEEGGKIFFIPGLPLWAYRFLASLPGWRIFRAIWFRLISKLSKETRRHFDFVKADPQETVNRLCRCLPANPFLQEFDLRSVDFEGVVFNGEGTMIMTKPPRRESLIFLMLIWWAHSLGKKIYFTNAMFSDCPATGSNAQTIETTWLMLKKCTAVSVRDPISLEYAKKHFPDVNVKFIPDALFTWKKYVEDNTFSVSNGRYILPFGKESNSDFNLMDFSKPYICISGSSLSAWDQKTALSAYLNLAKAIKTNFELPVYLVQVAPGDSFLLEVGRQANIPCVPIEIPILSGVKILSHAAVYISGRFHPSIMASLGGTPCVFLGSNSHKTWSLQHMLRYEKVKEFSANPKEEEIAEIIALAKKKLSLGNAERIKIQNVARELSEKAAELTNLIQ